MSVKDFCNLFYNIRRYSCDIMYGGGEVWFWICLFVRVFCFATSVSAKKRVGFFSVSFGFFLEHHRSRRGENTPLLQKYSVNGSVTSVFSLLDFWFCSGSEFLLVMNSQISLLIIFFMTCPCSTLCNSIFVWVLVFLLPQRQKSPGKKGQCLIRGVLQKYGGSQLILHFSNK